MHKASNICSDLEHVARMQDWQIVELVTRVTPLDEGGRLAGGHVDAS